nr:HAMP domain-containing protein [bacterium]
MAGPIRRMFRRSRPAALGLRRRILLIITLGSIALSVLLAATTFGLTRSNLVAERDEVAIDTSRRNALGVERDLRPTLPSEPIAARASLDRIGVQRYMIWYRDSQYGTPPYTRDNIPPELFEQVVGNATPARQIVRIEDDLNIIVGWSVPDVGAYFEFFPLDDVDSTLSNLRVALVLAALITTGLGVLVGILSARRAVRPLGTAAQAASAIAGGRLDTRLGHTEDPDLRVLTESFNDMAEALEKRVERDARFASDVSHELRSPLMTLAASVEVMEARRDDLPER